MINDMEKFMLLNQIQSINKNFEGTIDTEKMSTLDSLEYKGLYDIDKPFKVKSIVISTQHSPDVDQYKVKELVGPYIKKSIPKGMIDPKSYKKFIEDVEVDEKHGKFLMKKCQKFKLKQFKHMKPQKKAK